MAPEDEDNEPITAKAETRVIEHGGMVGGAGSRDITRTREHGSEQPRTPPTNRDEDA
jgi:hypothetical protein